MGAGNKAQGKRRLEFETAGFGELVEPGEAAVDQTGRLIVGTIGAQIEPTRVVRNRCGEGRRTQNGRRERQTAITVLLHRGFSANFQFPIQLALACGAPSSAYCVSVLA